MNQTSSKSLEIPSASDLARMQPEDLKLLQQRIMEAQIEMLLQEHAEAKREYQAMLEKIGEKVFQFQLTAPKFLAMTAPQLQKHLMQVARGEAPSFGGGGVRPVARVPPKYRNPSNHEQTWTGRGNRPGWVKAHLDGGGNLQEVEIPDDEAGSGPADTAG
jgi:DNA-binding protein H-NS